MYFACSWQRLMDAPGDLIEFLICSVDIAIQNICDQEDAAARMVEGDDPTR